MSGRRTEWVTGTILSEGDWVVVKDDLWWETFLVVFFWDSTICSINFVQVWV